MGKASSFTIPRLEIILLSFGFLPSRIGYGRKSLKNLLQNVI